MPDRGSDERGSSRQADDFSGTPNLPVKRNPFSELMNTSLDLGQTGAREGSTAPARRGRSIGEILARDGRLSVDDIARIVALQTEKGVRFGEAAVQLGLVAKVDIQEALARQFDYPYVLPGSSTISRDVVAAYKPFGSHAEGLRALREELIGRWIKRSDGGNALSIVSPGRREGRSYMAANLAVVFAQMGMRTLLIDADMRHPSQRALFGLDGHNGLSAVLSRRGDGTAIYQVAPFEYLSILPAGVQPPNPHELLAREEFARLISRVQSQADVVLVDTPAGSECADAQSVSVATRGALMITRKHSTRGAYLASFDARLREAQVNVVGTVLNEF